MIGPSVAQQKTKKQVYVQDTVKNFLSNSSMSNTQMNEAFTKFLEILEYIEDDKTLAPDQISSSMFQEAAD